MIRPSPRRTRPSPLAVLAGGALAVASLAVAPSLGAQSSRPATRPASTRPATSKPQEAPMQAELEMMEAEATFRGTLDSFVAAAVAGQGAKVAAMISPNMRERAGAAAVQGVVEGQILPFFAGTRGLGGSRTITTTTDQFGNAGFTYYTYALAPDGELLPFVLYTVRENGAVVVANVLVNKRVEGRHQ
jgi:hypothetical protein